MHESLGNPTLFSPMVQDTGRGPTGAMSLPAGATVRQGFTQPGAQPKRRWLYGTREALGEAGG